jgi:FlaA1/EpsC-like NDP-sugar epimerase
MINRHSVDAVIIAITSLNHKKLTMLYETACRAGVKTIKVVPRIYRLPAGDQPEGPGGYRIEDLREGRR